MVLNMLFAEGHYKNSAKDVRAARRDFTKTKEWLVTDPQIPKEYLVVFRCQKCWFQSCLRI